MQNSSIYKINSIRPAGDGYVVQSLPTHMDIVMAVVVVGMVSAAARFAHHSAPVRESCVRKREKLDRTISAVATAADEAIYVAVQEEEKLTEESSPEQGGRSEPDPSVTVNCNFVAPQPDNRRPRIHAFETPATSPPQKQPPEPAFVQSPMKYFDNAGGVYANKAARDAAEEHRLVASLRRFPAMKPKHRAIMRERAFARLATLDMQQGNNTTP
jgi:hypothetical protein